MSQSTLDEITRADPAYTGYLGELRNASTRVEAGRLTARLSSVADDLAAALLDIGPVTAADADTACDPLAWKDVTTHLIRISLALSGGTFDTADCDDLDDAAEWIRLAETTDRAAFAAAWEPIKASLTRMSTRRAGGRDPELRKFAVTQILTAADAVINSRW